MAGEIRRGVERAGALVVHDGDQAHVARPLHQRGVHQLLREQARAFDVDGLVLLAGADVQQTDGSLLVVLEGVIKLARGDLHRAVLLATRVEVIQDFAHVAHLLVALADLREGFVLGKAATRAAADVILAEQRPPRAGINGEDLAHGKVRIESVG